MKIFINNRDYVTWPSAMAELLANQGHEIIFIDNASTWEPLLDWYESCSFEVKRQENLGPHTAHWKYCLGEKEPYVFTDPDYDLSMVPEDWPEVLSEPLARLPNLPKCGLSFDLSRVPQENYAYPYVERMCPKDNPECGLMVTWGSVHPQGDLMYYSVDTSFAVYRPKLTFDINGLMKVRPYTGVHLPFHVVLEPSADSTKLSVIMNDEIAYYHENATTLSNSAQGGLTEPIKEYHRRKNEQ